jgi:pimeloyl-ACP methyl ester carboxylesterase
VPDSSVRTRIGENRVPSLLVVGEREKRFLAHRDYARSHMPQLRIESTDAGHAVNIEAAEPFNRTVVEFLSRFARV